MCPNDVRPTLDALAAKLGEIPGPDRERELDELFSQARELSRGTAPECRAALDAALAALSLLDRYGTLLAGLAGEGGRRAVERERGRWAELLDSARVRLAKGRPVVIHLSRRRGRTA